MKRSWVVSFFALSVVVLLVALLLRWRLEQAPDAWANKPTPRVLVTIPPLASFVQNVGPNVSLACLCTNEGPAKYEPTEADAVLLRQGNLFLASGLGVDDRLADALHEKAPEVPFRKVSAQPPGGLTGTEGDPRVWLGLSNAIVLVGRIRGGLKAVDPAHSADYEQNAERYIARLRSFQEKGKKRVEEKKDRRFVSVAGPLRHFADSFGLTLAGSYQLGETEGPGAKVFDEVLGQCVKPDGVQVLASAPRFGRSATARELDAVFRKHKVAAALVVVDPLETGEGDLSDPGWFVRKMSDNLNGVLKYLK